VLTNISVEAVTPPSAALAAAHVELRRDHIDPGSVVHLAAAPPEQPFAHLRLIEYRELPPSDPIEHLVSCIRGVGTATAERIVDHFGADNVRQVGL
jgi:hypothetical protein